MRFADGTVLRLYRQTVEDFGLYPGKELSQEELEKLQSAAGAMSAKMRAVRIVAATNVSQRDLEHRLIQKGEDPAQAHDAVQWMQDLHLVDDRRTAEQIVGRCIGKGYGLQRAKQMLYEKRIPKEFWEEVLEGYPEQTDAIEAVLRSRLGSEWDERELRKAVDALLRRGHSYSQIRSVLNTITPDKADFLED